MVKARLIAGLLTVALVLPGQRGLSENRFPSSIPSAVFTEQTLTLRGDVFRFDPFTRTPAIMVLGLIPGTPAAEKLNRGIAEGRLELVKQALLDDAPLDELTYVVGAYDLENGILPEVMVEAFKLLKIHDDWVEPAAHRAWADIHALWFRLRESYIARHTEAFDLTIGQWFHRTEGHAQEVGRLFNIMFLKMLIKLHALIKQDTLKIEQARAILNDVREEHRQWHLFYLRHLAAA